MATHVCARISWLAYVLWCCHLLLVTPVRLLTRGVSAPRALIPEAPAREDDDLKRRYAEASLGGAR